MSLKEQAKNLIVIFNLIHFIFYYFKILPLSHGHFWIIQSILCLLYFMALFYELKVITDPKTSEMPKKYRYLPPWIWFKTTLVSVFFLIYGIFLIILGKRLQYLVPLVWMISIGEIVLYLFKKWSGQYYLMFFANYVDFHLGTKKALFAKDIQQIRLARDIVYLFLNNKRIKEIRLFYMEGHEKEDFKKQLEKWALSNNVNYSD